MQKEDEVSRDSKNLKQLLVVYGRSPKRSWVQEVVTLELPFFCSYTATNHYCKHQCHYCRMEQLKCTQMPFVHYSFMKWINIQGHSFRVCSPSWPLSSSKTDSTEERQIVRHGSYTHSGGWKINHHLQAFQNNAHRGQVRFVLETQP